MFIRELHLSYSARTPVDGVNHPVKIANCRDAVSLMAPLLETEAVEVFYVLCLTTPLTLIGYYQASRGSLDETSVHPRDVLKMAMLANAAAIVVIHNHPSGDPTPSTADLAVTSRLKAAGDVLGIALLDHVIVGHEGRYVSLKEQGRL